MSTGIAPAPDSAAQTCCPIVELRQYTLHPGKRDALIDLFDREFVEPQEAVGMKIIGQFRDLDNPDRFVWLRGFSDMSSRAQALGAFYGGPVWKTHREAANATMIDSDNVLLLRAVSPESGFSLAPKIRLAYGVDDEAERLIIATICYLAKPVTADFVKFFKNSTIPKVVAAGAEVLAYFASEQSVNTFPALPVRENENVFVWFARFSDPASPRRYEPCGKEITAELARQLTRTPETLKLSPTARSLL
jgi:hypothetical protein